MREPLLIIYCILILIASLAGEAHTALASPRQMARFLCGLASPSASRAGLTRDSRFGHFLRFAQPGYCISFHAFLLEIFKMIGQFFREPPNIR